MLNINDKISVIKGVGTKTLEKLNDASIYTIKDLILLSPKKYNYLDILLPSDELDGNDFVVEGYISSQIVSRKFRNSVDNIIFSFQTATKKLKALAFGRGYLKFSLKKGMNLKIYGTYKALDNSFIVKEIVSEENRYVNPIYGIKGLNDGLISKLLTNIFSDIPKFKETLPEEILIKYRLVGINDFLRLLHFPNTKNDVINVIRRKKYAMYFNYALQMSSLSLFIENNSKKPKDGAINEIIEFTNSLPYKLTNSQKEAINQIVIDSKRPYVMNRLIQGDVGSGKTLVATVAILINLCNKYQSILMAPTEILATQHFKNIEKALQAFNPSISLLTSSLPASKKNKIIDDLELGRIDILITTQAALYHNIHYKNLGLLIIDEQHRFGVNDRQKILLEFPHTDALYLSATPIPRTLGLTKFADMDISSMREKPINRQKIVTRLYDLVHLDEVYNDMKERIDRDEQAFCVGALIEGDSYLDLNSIKEMVEKNVPGAIAQIMHGALSPMEKNKIMIDFINKKFNILVSTTVIEVGIDVKNATGIYIFNAERFGMSTLHQLRGRVGRNDKAAFCALISNDINNERLKVLENTDDCFCLAEYDLKFRGPGEFLGEAQSGFLSLDFETDYKIYQAAESDAKAYLTDYKNGKEVTGHILKVIEEMSNKKAKLN